MDARLDRLEKIIEHMGEAVIATTDTLDRFAARVDLLADQVQQQGYQIFALSDTIQTLAENQEAAMMRLDMLVDTLQRLAVAIEQVDESESESASKI